VGGAGAGTVGASTAPLLLPPPQAVSTVAITAAQVDMGARRKSVVVAELFIGHLPRIQEDAVSESRMTGW
jgi:hypothetical protein